MLTERQLARLRTVRIPKPNPCAPLPVFSVHADTVVTYRKSTRYTDGVECVAWRSGQLVGMCWLPRGWDLGGFSGLEAYAAAFGGLP